MKSFIDNIKQFPSAIFGSIMIILLVALAIYVVIAIPYRDAIYEWRGSEEIQGTAPKNARPTYVNWFRTKKYSETILIDSTNPEDEVEKTVTEVAADMWDIQMVFKFDYPYDGFPQELQVILSSIYKEKSPFVTLTWFTPDGEKIKVADITAKHHEVVRFDLQDKLVRKLDGVLPRIGLLRVPDVEPYKVQKGTYELHVDTIVFEEGSDIEAKFVSFGQVHGLAGTDHRRRDLMLPLLWGAPIALSFGFLAAIGTTFTTMFIAAIGVWFGGLTDEIIQRITEIYMLLPFLPILIMVGVFYSRSIWTMLWVVILISLFGAGIKNFRAIFLQIKEAAYIEAARSYGAGNWRIINRYLVPRIIPILIPGLVSAIPSYVFLEASLAVLGLGDPILPTWGKVINDAQMQGALYNGYYYWVLQPAVLLMVTGLSFAMIGFALDRIFNPKLREV
ncbi:MAG TPA: ABC transporter permease [Brevefilum fermentans]|jgi:peptide/nickel transport system permease protein|uniref:Putative oligopeptide ABC transporter permease protein n=1 Tax=Candidatus Brevifilum fermentans TaxID=1986204 RepID=A0A1Y6K083_9CHLR|nr:ABC transporter permease [Brevefilum fermentans]MDI9567063.1 ABC transporter permease [Chloroflexota bacterium]OQB88040.1 MAG: Oligopeptide transport system permease protein OppC [Chloroflexi bacterium ADurb.Bin120]SMX53102.1 putative oligopeptide ABC transporter permease protein [Brevefilum fermentans]HOM67435.1 ABC transporter permease [Brevefilum fermentans]HPX95118.1 ABC transporter permease [Brevefilum fermentans]